jgi:hypothetical protein
LSKFDSKAREGIFVGYATESHSFGIFDKESARVVEVSNVIFNENDGSRVEQSGVCDIGDEIPPHAIRRMDVGHLIPIEEHLLAEGEGQCSTQVEPSSSQTQQALQGPIDANQRKVIRLKLIYNFLCSMLVYAPFALCFVTLCGVFMHFPELTY